MRQIVLDTETTGLEPAEGHKIIEVGCVELINRRPTGNDRQIYLNPDRMIDAGAIEVHGITNEFLRDKPRFGDVVDDLMNYLRGAELVIHNAAFDVGFLDAELKWHAEATGKERTNIAANCEVLDTLAMAREKHPGQRNSLDALCKRYEIDNSHREKHGALLDSEILAEVYLSMTGGQSALLLDNESEQSSNNNQQWRPINREGLELVVAKASEEEAAAHLAYLEFIRKKSDDQCAWDKL